jgi:hypothetical protein
MTANRIVLIAFGTALLATAGAAQTPSAQLLEKGIFTEETVGDLDGAIRIYRQILAAPQVARDVAVQTEFRLAEALRKSTPQARPAAAQQHQVEGCCGMFSGNYDPALNIVVSGKVTAAQWMNPLTVVFVDGDDGNKWALTLAAPNAMIRGGMTKDSLKPGQQVLATGFLAKGEGDNCPAPLPNACATLTYQLMADAAKSKPPAMALHASATTITAIDGTVLFNRQTINKAVADQPQP